MNLIQSAYDQARHPRCEPTPLGWRRLTIRVLVLWLFFTIAILVWPSWWWGPLIAVLAVSLVMHPFCLISSKTHAPGGHWFHFEPV